MPEKDRTKAIEAERRLKAAKDKALRRKLGPALSLSDIALEQAAEVREADLASAEAWWDNFCPTEARGLLSAEVIEPDG
jgi:hypothetical protein